GKRRAGKRFQAHTDHGPPGSVFRNCGMENGPVNSRWRETPRQLLAEARFPGATAGAAKGAVAEGVGVAFSASLATPAARRFSISRLRRSALTPPNTTPMSRTPPREAVVTRLYPD